MDFSDVSLPHKARCCFHDLLLGHQIVVKFLFKIMAEAENIASDSFLDFLLTESDHFVAAVDEDNDEPVVDVMSPPVVVTLVPSSSPQEDDPHAGVPTHMLLGQSLEALSSQLSHAPLEQLVMFVAGKETAPPGISSSPQSSPTPNSIPYISTETTTTTLADIVRQHNRPTLCLVMRRPGCPFCREDALQLSRFVQQHNQTVSSLATAAAAAAAKGDPREQEELEPLWHLMGVVKDTSDAQGLHELATQYFCHPLYRDVDRTTYRGFGQRTVGWRRLLHLPKGLYRTSRQQHIAWNMRGWTDTIQGGVLILDETGALRYAHREIYADQLVLDDIRAAVRAVVDRRRRTQRPGPTSNQQQQSDQSLSSSSGGSPSKR
jgi:hypothetical protein